MADIRINALANTATTPASDDYLALDGAAQGTRKILATNIANNVTDVILGASGPSVKSTLSARAPRQGLVFDGTAGATVSVPAPGTGDYTRVFWINTNTIGAAKWLMAAGSGPTLGIYITTTGNLAISDLSTGGYVSTGTIVAGKTYMVSVRRSGTSLYFGFNGIEESAVTDTRNYTVATSTYGSASGAAYFDGFISGLAYNRALSASEVVSLYEAGAPAGADYNSASNTAISNGTFADYSSFGYPISSASASGFTASSASGTKIALAALNRGIVSGAKYRLTYTLTLNSGQAPNLNFTNSSAGSTWANIITLAAGTQTVELTAVSTQSSGVYIQVYNTAATNFVLSNISIVPAGLLLAPDAAQAGGGLTWYDTSGNAANITLPASGVSWNVPSSQKTARGWTFGGNLAASGNLTVSGAAVTMDSTSAGVGFRGTSGGHNRFSLIRDDTLYPGSVLLSAFGEVDLMYGATTTATSGTVGARLTASGNFMIGSTGADGGQKLQVNGTAFANRYDVLFNDNPAGTSPRIFASAAAGSTVDVLVAGAGSRAGNIQYYNDGGGTSQLKFGTSVPSSTTEHVRFSMPTSGLGSSVVSIYGTTASTSTTTGALVVSGGVGVAGAVNVGGAIAIGNTVQTAAAVASTHKVTISIGGSTYYLLATNV